MYRLKSKFIENTCNKIDNFFLAKFLNKPLIECFHSRGQHLCKFIGTKEGVCIRIEYNSQRFGLGHQHGRT